MAITFAGKDQQIFKPFSGSVASGITGGGTGTVVYSIPTDYLVLIRAVVMGVYPTGGHLAGSFIMQSDFSTANYNGTGQTINGLSNGSTVSVNPMNSSATGMLQGRPEAADILGGGGQPPTALWTQTGTVAVLTVNNRSTNSIDCLVYLDIFQAKNV
jgi:hypothetical protein